MERTIETKFYEFSQNNSGGRFDVDENVCHRVIIEAMNEDHARQILEPMIENQSGSCSCCGDRWSPYYPDEIDLNKLSQNGVYASIYTHYKDYKERWQKMFGEFRRSSEPELRKNITGSQEYGATIFFDNVEEYAQYLANNWGWTAPDARIHYFDGTKKEVFKIDLD